MNLPSQYAGETGSKSLLWRAEWRRNWPISLSTFFGAGISTFHLQSLGPMIKPLSADFGWTRAEVASGLLIVSVGSLIMNPIVGTMIDRFGARRIALVGIVVFATALAALGLCGPSIWTWYAAYALLAVVSPTVTSLVWSKAVVDRFDRSRGLALGIMRSGLTLSGGLVPIFMVLATQALGWRGAYAALAATAVIMALPLAIPFFRDGPDPKLIKSDAETVATTVTGASLQEALGDSRFWRLAMALCTAALTTGFFTAHLQPMLTDGGLSAVNAALLTGVIGPTAAVAGLVYGALADRVPAPPLTAAAFATPIVACLLVFNAGETITPQLALLIVLSIGIALGSEGDSIAFLVGRFFGRRAYGAISGVIMSFFILGFGLGPVIGGAVFDATGSYKPAMLGAAAVLLVSALLVGTLGRYPRLEASEASS